MKTVAIIRDRGQVTIPDSFRKIARWTGVNSVVNINLQDPEEISITPHKPLGEEYWDKLFGMIGRARDIKGKSGMSSSDFIAKARNL